MNGGRSRSRADLGANAGAKLGARIGAIVALAAASGGCGGGSGALARTKLPAGPPAGAVAVIRDWSATLARGDVAGAARYFATPSVIQLDPTEPAVRLATEAEIRAANLALPCGAKLVSSREEDGYIDSLFRLGNRPGGDCGSGVGLTARVAFVIESGRIAEWRRIPDEPGDSAYDAPGVRAPAQEQPSGPGVSAI